MKIIFSLILISLLFISPSLHAQTAQKNRVIILSDIEADPDDTQIVCQAIIIR